jgi:aryl-alcohol dehydrogenase-like predicted oxidoreductase
MKLALGTVQFGLDYGITNVSGVVSSKEVKAILSLAKKSNISILDTASVYGNSEQVLGDLANNSFRIISKIPSLFKFDGTIRNSFFSTLTKVNRDAIYGMMLHDERDIYNTSQYHELCTLKEEGLINKIGCSFYSLEALEFAMDKNIELDIIQIPASCLDQRFEQSGLLERAKEKGIEIHCRSLFLQGLLLGVNILPASLKPFENDITNFFSFAKSQNIKPIELALLYVHQNKFIDYGVVGCQSKIQLEEIIDSYRNIENMQLNMPISNLASSSEVLLNPSLWN